MDSARHATRAALAALACVGCSGPATPISRPAAGPSRLADAAVAAPDAPVVSQEETLAAVQAAMVELDGAAHHCWGAAAAIRFDIQGDLDARIEIGAVPPAVVTIVRDTARNADLARCMTAVLEAYPWAPPLRGQTIQLPFAFHMPDAQSIVDRALVPWKAQGKLAVAVLLDEYNTGKDDASMLEVALDAGATTGWRGTSRAELWLRLSGDGEVREPGKPAAPLAMMYVPPGGAREVAAGPHGLHAIVVYAPGEGEGAARAGALPTPEVVLAGKVAHPQLAPLPGGTATRLGPFEVSQEAPGGGSGGTVELDYLTAGRGTLTVGGLTQPIGATSAIALTARDTRAVTATEPLVAWRVLVRPPAPAVRAGPTARPGHR